MRKPIIFIDGQAGTTGLQILDRLKYHDGVEILSLDENTRKNPKAREEALNSCNIAVLCLPDDAAVEAVSLVKNPAVKILDASSAHRTKYGWVYGLPEYSDTHPDLIAAAKRVANPGCYPTGAILLLKPLISAGIIPEDYPIVISGASGYSGGGKSLIARYEDKNLDNHINSALRYYGLGLDHKHLAEMQDYCLLKYSPLFLPMVANCHSGMVITIGIKPRLCAKNTDMALIHQIYQKNYQSKSRIYLAGLGYMPPESACNIEEMATTDDIELFIFADKNNENIVLMARYDNLGKGASGAAIQNINLMLRSIS